MELEKKLLTVTETAEICNLSRPSIYELINKGELPVIKFGRKTLIPANAIDAWIDRLIGTDSNS